MRADDAAAAAAAWQRARDRACGGGLGDTPFRAVAETNLAVALAEHRAQDSGLRAAAAWTRIAQRVEGEDMPLPARSSVFHLKLAATHAAPFSAYLRSRALTLARTGAALADANARPETTDLPLYGDPDVPKALPDFLFKAVQAHQTGRLGRPLARDLVSDQIDHLRSYGGVLPRTFRAQLEACLGFCAFAPLIAALNRDGPSPSGDLTRD